MRTKRLISAALVLGLAFPAAPAVAAPHRSAVHFDLALGQQPENIALGPDGTAYVTFATARQVAAVSPDGRVRVLATLPAPPDGGAGTPVLGFALTVGIVRAGDGTLYFLYASGDPASTGLYRLRPGGAPHRVAALPGDGLPNGLALDERTGTFYATDSVLGVVYAVTGGVVRTFARSPLLARSAFLGANGVKLHRDALWVGNLDAGTLLRIPLRGGDIEVRARGLSGVDDFAFTGSGDEVVATLNEPNQVVRVSGDGRSSTLLTGADGLQNPTSVAVRGTTVTVLSAAYRTRTDPNLLRVTLPRR